MDSRMVFPGMALSFSAVYGHYRRVEPGWSYHDHHHAMFEWLYCVEGQAIEWVKDHPHRLQTGDWLLLKPDVRHSTLNDAERPFAYVSIHFDVEDAELRSRLQTAASMHPSAELQEISSAMNRWLQAHRAEPTLERRMELMIILMRLVCAWLSASAASPEHPEATVRGHSPRDIELAHQVAQMLEQDRVQPVRIQELAQQLHVSRNHLSRIFAKVYAMSPRQYQSLLRMRKAKELLIHTPLSAEDIGLELGFSSLSHFSRQFKHWTGTSPQQFRSSLPR